MKKLSTILTILAILSVFGLYALNNGEQVSLDPTPAPTPLVTIENTTPSPNVTYSFRAEANNQTAYELLQSKADIVFGDGTQESAVFSVNGMKNTDERRWTLLVNGQPATQAAERTTLRAGDEITLSYDAR